MYNVQLFFLPLKKTKPKPNTPKTTNKKPAPSAFVPCGEKGKPPVITWLGKRQQSKCQGD